MNVDKEKDEKEIIMLKGALKEKASCISDLMYLVDDFKVLQKALDPLKNVFKAMDAACVKQEGLPIQQSPRKQSRKLKLENVEYHKVFHSKLSLRRWSKRATGFKSNKASQNAISFDLTEDDNFEPPVKHHRSAAALVSTVSCQFNLTVQQQLK